MSALLLDPRRAAARGEAHYVARMARMKRGSRILDMGCGIGRHCTEFAKMGMDVVGLDFTEAYIRQANRELRGKNFKDRVKYVCGDMRELSDHFEDGSFDSVVSLGNTFGYFPNRRDDLAVLRQVSRVLRPGGTFIINTLSHPGFKYCIHDVPRMVGKKANEWWIEARPGYFLLDRSFYDPRRQKLTFHWRLIDVKRSRVRSIECHQNVYSPADFRGMLSMLGLKAEKLWGDLSGARYTPHSLHQTIIARKIRHAL